MLTLACWTFQFVSQDKPDGRESQARPGFQVCLGSRETSVTQGSTEWPACPEFSAPSATRVEQDRWVDLGDLAPKASDIWVDFTAWQDYVYSEPPLNDVLVKDIIL